MPILTTRVVGRGNQSAHIILSPYTPRSRVPKTVRLTFREALDHPKEAIHLTFDNQLNIHSALPLFWEALSTRLKEEIFDKIQQRFREVIQPEVMEWKEALYRIHFDKEDITYPFRPTANHCLGLDSSGRDVLTRILYALRIALNFGFLLVLVTMAVSILVGGVQGYFGGKIDTFGQRIIEIWESLPFIYILILMGSIYGRSFSLLLICYGIFNWIGVSYYMRGEFFKLRDQPFVEAAKCMGLPSRKIILNHILPNGLVPVITFFPFSLVSAIGILAALDYLGFGLPSPTPSWGELLAQAQEYGHAWWLALYPSLALFVVMLLGVLSAKVFAALLTLEMIQKWNSYARTLTR